MCIGIAIVVVSPEDGGPTQIYGRSGNSSHDELLHEIPVELHNRATKIEYIYPHSIRLDAPDEECRKMAIDLGTAEIGPFGLRLKGELVQAVFAWIAEAQIDFAPQTLQEADLRRANLQEADLQGANLREANLWEADLRRANLREANLWEADLQGADLREANLRRADLQGADLRRADLREANLQGADLREANLWEANLENAKTDGVIGLAEEDEK